MKVIHLVEAMGGSAHLWGKERVIHWLMREQRASGTVDPSVVTFTPALLHDVLRDEGFSATCLSTHHSAFPKAALSALMLHLRANPDTIVHSHGYKANIVGRIAKLLGAPMQALLSTSHGFDSYARRLAMYNAADRFTGYASNIVTVTDPRMAKKFPPGVRTCYVANALPDKSASTPEQRANGRATFSFTDGQFVVGMLHRLIPQKGVDEFIEAAELACKWGRLDIVFAIAGDGPLREMVEQAATRIPTLRYLGYVDPPDEYLAAIDAFVQPSRSEGLSLALLQAMRAERPIIATRVGATEETVSDGVEGMLIEAHDPAALTAAVLRLADDWQYAATLATAARQRFTKDFRIERQHKDFEALYLSISGRSKAAR